MLAQVGTGDRSEKIKTYNFKDSRMSDHRIKANFDLNKCLEGACCWVLCVGGGMHAVQAVQCHAARGLLGCRRATRAAGGAPWPAGELDDTIMAIVSADQQAMLKDLADTMTAGV